ncbi:MAG: hypothetical protein BGO31_15590 [Bacteroidetes bacterium 43-16]|nr:MAG: hypothetical protein BGO31_15590 [Bacteroidetes bacterium 43-16]
MIGDDLKKLRESNNFTQQELAEALGMTRKTVNSYENGATIPIVVQMGIKYFFKDKMEGDRSIGVGKSSNSDYLKLKVDEMSETLKKVYALVVSLSSELDEMRGNNDKSYVIDPAPKAPKKGKTHTGK